MLKCCFKDRILWPFSNEPRRLLDCVAHAALIRNHYSIFVAVNLLGDIADRITGAKRSFRLWRVHNKVGPINLEVEAFQALPSRHQLRLGQIQATATHGFIIY